jgi:membrane-associated protease RseP (regulator of RpoE activity)
MYIILISLYLCILFHELAHLLAAKAVKCNVEVFSIGFGKAIFKFKYKGTIYQLAWLPLGGYNKLKSELEYSRSKYAFTNLPYTSKLLIAVAGCFINIVMGIVGYCLYPLVMQYSIYWSFFLFQFSLLSIVLGITNLIPIPALDGSYPFLVLLENKYGKKKGYALMKKINTICFKILMILNILCIPYAIYLFKKGVF